MALAWRDALRTVRDTFHTVDKSAASWLLAVVVEPECDLALLTLGYDATIAYRNENDENDWKPLDWPEEVRRHLGFSSGGALQDAMTVAVRAPVGLHDAWLVLRSALPQMQEAIARQLAEHAQKRDARQAARHDAFLSVHSRDLAVITSFLREVVRPDAPEWLRSHVLRVEYSDSATVADLYGSGGSVTIDLRGRQITDLADHIRKLTTRDNTCDALTTE